MRVSLLKHTPQPERIIASAARLCYAPVGAAELQKKLTKAEVKKLLCLILKSGHLSAVEHASFTFAIEGISRACTHQLVRHRLASYSQQSQRYVKYLKKPEFIVPPSINRKAALKRSFEEVANLAFKHYLELLDKGVPAEDARYILPQAIESKIVVTMNARELLHFFTLRCCNRAQWEIRELAQTMLKLVKKIAPILFADAGANCLRGPCPEGTLSCGKPQRKRKA